MPVMIAALFILAITAAVTGIAPSARDINERSGSQNEKKTSYPAATTM